MYPINFLLCLYACHIEVIPDMVSEQSFLHSWLVKMSLDRL